MHEKREKPTARNALDCVPAAGWAANGAALARALRARQQWHAPSTLAAADHAAVPPPRGRRRTRHRAAAPWRVSGSGGETKTAWTAGRTGRGWQWACTAGAQALCHHECSRLSCLRARQGSSLFLCHLQLRTAEYLWGPGPNARCGRCITLFASRGLMPHLLRPTSTSGCPSKLR